MTILFQHDEQILKFLYNHLLLLTTNQYEKTLILILRLKAVNDSCHVLYINTGRPHIGGNEHF